MGGLVTRDVVKFAVISVAILLAWAALNRLTSWLPWSTQSQLERVKDARDRYQGEATVSKLETEGERQSAARTHQTHTIIIQAERATSDGLRETYGAPDAESPMGADRADRVRRHQQRLCADQQQLCPAAPAGNPG